MIKTQYAHLSPFQNIRTTYPLQNVSGYIQHLECTNVSTYVQ